MTLSDADWTQLERYVTRRGTAEELAELERWVTASPELQAIARGMRGAGLDPGVSAPAWDEEVAWQRVSRRMRWFSRPPLTAGSARRRMPWAAAAAIILAVGAAALVELRSGIGAETDTKATSAAPAREVATGRGERAAFELPDGTRVMLGAVSRLTIPASYNRPGAGRDVHLDGEGYFEVTHDSLNPFRVHTSLGVAEDLGTEFVVTTYPETRGMRVVVSEGIVALRRGGSAERSRAETPPLLTLTPGDLARLDSTGTATVTRVDPASYVAWTRGALVFQSTPLREVVPRLARWYDVDLRLSDAELEHLRLTATFRDHSIEQALNLVALSLNLRVERTGDIVTLHRSHRP